MGWKDFIIVMVFYFSNTLFMTYMMNVVHDRMPDPKKWPALPDIVHEAIPLKQSDPFAHNLQAFSNVALIAILIPVLSAMVYTFRWNMGPFGCRWFATWGLVFHLRVWFMLATAIPPTEDMRCRFGPKPVIENWVWNSIIGLLSWGFKNIHCGDLIFSGHTILIALTWVATVTQLQHMPILIVGATIVCFMNMLIIIVIRNHYTVDVLCSFYVTCTVWQLLPMGRPPFLQVAWYVGAWQTMRRWWSSPLLLPNEPAASLSRDPTREMV
eukprot:EG_transcript_14489